MKPGDEVQIMKGEYQGKRARINGSDGWFFHLQLVTEAGRKVPDGYVTIHRTALTSVHDLEGIRVGRG